MRIRKLALLAALLPLVAAADVRQPSVSSRMIETSNNGSGGQTRAVLGGLEAHVVTQGIDSDIDAPAEKGKLLHADRPLGIAERKLEIRSKESAAKAKVTPSVTAGEKGFLLRSANGDHELSLSALIQADGRFFADSPGVSDTFLLRRLRPRFEGRLGKLVAFRLTPEFANGSGDSGAGLAARIVDAYLDLKFAAWTSVRAGKQKGPLGLERLQSDGNLLFIERGYPTELVPNRDLGVALYGQVLHGTTGYVAGIFNGTPDGRDINRVNADNRFEFEGRIFSEPLKSDNGFWHRLGLGVGASYGNQQTTPTTVADALPRYRTPGQNVFFSYVNGGAPNNTVIADGRHWRAVPQFYYYNGAFGLLGEYVLSSQRVALAGVREEFTHQAWMVQANYVLTGEDASYSGVRSTRPFTPGGAGWGALELGGRLEAFEADGKVFDKGFADSAKSAQRARSVGVVLNWYLTSNIKLAADYNLTRFEGGAAGGDRPDEQAVFTRLQLVF